jgi:hypothetical protein
MDHTDGNSNTDAVQVAASQTSEVLGKVDQLTAHGWQRKNHLATFTIGTTQDDAGEDLAPSLLSLHPLMSAGALRWESGEGYIDFQVSEAGTLEMVGHSDGDLQNIFSDEEMETGKSAFREDVGAALHLSGRWWATAEIDPAKAMAGAVSDYHWLVLRDEKSVVDLLLDQPWWELRHLVQRDRPLVVLMQRVSTGTRVWTESVLVESLNGFDLGALAEHHLTTELSRMLANAAPAQTPDPRALIPAGSHDPNGRVDVVIQALRRQAAACCWAGLASSVHIAGEQSIVEFFGLRREEWTLSKSGVVLDEKQSAAIFDLWRACADTDNPDRILAVRQVISLQSEAPWAKAADIDSASQPLYTAMRSEASAEALRTQREARSLALGVSRDTANATLALAKSTVERTIAVFLSIAAIIVAKTTKALTAAQAADLRYLLAIVLFVLVPWSFFIEGRTVTTPTSAFPADLETFSSLLSESDRNEILQTPGFTRATTQAWIARIVVPVAYLAAGILALLVS